MQTSPSDGEKQEERQSLCLGQRRWKQELYKLGCVNSHRGFKHSGIVSVCVCVCVSWAPAPAGCIRAGGVSTGSASAASSEWPLIHWAPRVLRCTEQDEFAWKFPHRLLTGETVTCTAETFQEQNVQYNDSLFSLPPDTGRDGSFCSALVRMHAHWHVLEHLQKHADDAGGIFNNILLICPWEQSKCKRMSYLFF